MSRPVALITGVSRRVGIGAAVATRLGHAGFDLFLHAWSPADAVHRTGADADGGAALPGEIAAETGARVEYAPADLADPAAPAALFDAAVAAFGHVDVLIANHARTSSLDLEHVTAAELDLTYAVNTRATLLLVQELARRHDDTRLGRVVLMTSGQHRGPMPGELPYIASKGALHQVTSSLAAHLAPRRITVNAVDPGATDTGYADDAARAWVLEREPMGRWGAPDDAARLITWLAGPDSAWVTGQVMVSSGGGP